LNVLLIGNLGYIGPIVAERFRENYTNNHIAGFDIGYFSHILSTDTLLPETVLDAQYFGDVRQFSVKILQDIDAVVYLAAISNDPMGKEFEKATFEVNQNSAVKIAKACKNAGVKSFVFASSCSVYGSADDKPRNEYSDLNPLTAYAKSKVNTEKELEPLADKNFLVTCLRFATACGFSPRLRLDLVLNDFVASALAVGKIEILSDGTPWRPLIHVKDMAKAIEWSCNREKPNGGNFLTVNTGSNDWNYQIRDLAQAVKGVIGNVDISINQNAQPDKRSYQVDFSRFKKLAGNFYPKVDLNKAVNDLYEGLRKIEFSDNNFRNSSYIRLKTLQDHIKDGRLNDNLEWI